MNNDSQKSVDDANTHPRLEHLIRILQAIRKVNRLIVTENDPRRLVEQACVNLTVTMGYHSAWIALLGGEVARGLGLPDAGAIAAVAAAGLDDEFEATRDLLEDGVFPDCMEHALSRADVSVVDNPTADCPECPLRSECGDRSGLACRLAFDGVTYGILTACVPPAYARDDEEQDLFREVADDLAYALHRIAATRKAKESYQHLAFVIEGSGAGTWEWNAQTNETTFNEQWAAMLGYTLEELTPYDYATWERLVHPDDIDQARQSLADCIDGKTLDYKCEFRMRHKDGHWVWILDQGRVMTRDDAGQALSMYGTHTDITEQKRLQNESIKAQNFFETVLEHSPIPMWIGDASGTLIRTNQALREALNLTDEQLVGRYNPLRDPNVVREGLTEIIRAVIEQHKPARFKALWRPVEFGGEGYESGLDRHVDLAMYPIVRDGKLQNIVTQWQDMTEYVQTESALRESERRLHLAMESASEGIWEWDFTTGLVAFDDVALGMLGYEPSFPPQSGEWWFTQVHAEDLPTVEKAFAAFVAGEKEKYRTEFRIAGRTGDYVWVSSNARIVRSDEQGKPLLVVGIHRDITQEKQAALALEEALLRHRETVKAGGVGLWDWDLKTDKVQYSPEWKRQIGYEEDEIGDGFDEWESRVHPDDLPQALGHARQMIRDRASAYQLEFRFLHKDGSYRHILAQARVLTDEQGEPVRTLGSHIDITERKQAEAERERLSAQLQQSQKMESVGRLAGGVAHDFNNMLGVILGHAEILSEELPSDGLMRDSLDEIRQAAERSANLTRQLLAFARKQTVAPKVLDLDETLEDMLTMLKRLIGEDIDIAWLPGGQVWPVRIDPGQIGQIMVNLCVNARDAIAGVGKVTIETGNTVFDDDYCRDHAGFKPGEYAMLAVSDNGCGMDAETLSHMFEPFFTTKAVGKGTGLGLATIYGIVKQNDGFINVYSETGQGSTFRIYLPRHKAKASQASQAPEQGPEKPSARGRETVLLVEDEPSILRLTTKMLERQGYTVAGARTPGEAIRIAMEHAGDIHLLMTDVVMPEMNGRDLAKNIQSLYPGVKCLYMSGYTANVIAHHGILDEGVNFIQKPFSRRDIADKVRAVLDRE